MTHNILNTGGRLCASSLHTLIPAVRHLLTASGTLGRGGSIIENSPTKHNPSMGKFTYTYKDACAVNMH